jgi:hypothetical protein
LLHKDNVTTQSVLCSADLLLPPLGQCKATCPSESSDHNSSFNHHTLQPGPLRFTCTCTTSQPPTQLVLLYISVRMHASVGTCIICKHAPYLQLPSLAVMWLQKKAALARTPNSLAGLIALPSTLALPLLVHPSSTLHSPMLCPACHSPSYLTKYPCAMQLLSLEQHSNRSSLRLNPSLPAKK